MKTVYSILAATSRSSILRTFTGLFIFLVNTGHAECRRPAFIGGSYFDLPSIAGVALTSATRRSALTCFQWNEMQ